jgi:hypothetical protein
MPDIRYVTVYHIDENFYLDTRYVYLVDRFKSFINEPKNVISVGQILFPCLFCTKM